MAEGGERTGLENRGALYGYGGQIPPLPPGVSVVAGSLRADSDFLHEAILPAGDGRLQVRLDSFGLPWSPAGLNRRGGCFLKRLLRGASRPARPSKDEQQAGRLGFHVPRRSPFLTSWQGILLLAPMLHHVTVAQASAETGPMRCVSRLIHALIFLQNRLTLWNGLSAKPAAPTA